MKRTTNGAWPSLAAFGSVLALAVAGAAAWLLVQPHHALGQQRATQALVRLPGDVSSFARPEYDLGEAAASLRMSGLQLVLARTPAQQQALNKLIADQQDPHSPQYHHWLTSSEFGARFGASAATIAALSGWLESAGLIVGRVPAGRDYLPFFGTRERVEAALYTRIHEFNIRGTQHYSNISDPSVPASFGTVIAAVGGLNDFYPVPGLRSQWIGAAPGGARAPQPDVYEGAIGSYGYAIPGFVGPTDAARIYDMAGLYASGVTGKGVTVAIVAQSDIAASQLSAYWSAFGVNQGQSFTSIPVPTASGGNDPGQTSDGFEDEAYLDTEIIGGLAPGAALLLVRDKNAGIAAQYVIDQDFPASGGAAAGATGSVGILNISFGQCEAAIGAANTTLSQMFQKAVTEGITITVSSGDAGAGQTGPAAAAGCLNSADEEVQGDVASKGLAVNGFASTPYTLSVGGTDFDPNLEGSAGGAYWSATNTGAALYSAATHVPEMVWNTSCGNAEWSEYFGIATALALCNQTNLNTTAFGTIANPFIEILGGGGGVSSCTSLNAGACAGGYAQPAWQQNVPGIASFGGRAVPDVSAIANRWVICSYDNNPCTVVPLPGGKSFSGTSAAAPLVAAIIALVDQQMQAGGTDGRQGLLNPLLYQLAATEYGSATNLTACDASQGAITSTQCVFYDVTLGSNAQPCVVASFADTRSAPSSSCNDGANAGFATGLMTASGANSPGSYAAGQGYDLASGLGSIDAANLVSAVAGLAPPSGLTASANVTSVNLNWNPAPAIDGPAASFNVYEGTAAGQEGASPVQTLIKSDSTTVAGLENGQTYYFKIAIVTTYGVSADSNEASVTIVPAVPAGLTASAGNGSVALSWSAATGAATYSVYQGTSAGGESASAVASVSGTTTTINGLTNGTDYFFKVTAVDSGGASAASNEASAMPMAPSSSHGGGGGAVDWLTLITLGLLGATGRSQRRPRRVCRA